MNRATTELFRLAEAQTNPFKKGAFTKAANALQPYDDSELVTMTFNELKKIPGVGASSAQVVVDLYSKGSCDRLEKECLPRECNFTELRGVGIVTARRLIKRYGVTTIGELAKCNIPDDLRHKIETWERLTSRLPRYEVKPLVDSVIQLMSEHNVKIIPVGSYRRYKSTIGDLDFVVYSNTSPKKVAKILKDNLYFDLESIGSSKLLCNITIEDISVHADFIFPKKESIATAILYLTGSKDFNVGMRAYAKKLGYTLNEHGLFFHGKERVTVEKEKDVFDVLGLPYVHACARELYADSFGTLVSNYSDIISAEFVANNWHCLHTHTTYSDGGMSIKRLACLRSKMKVLGVSDHSAPNPAGLHPAKFTQYITDCRKHKILAGVELEVMGNGSLPKGFTPKVLQSFDYFVLACHILPHTNVVGRLVKAIAKIPKTKPVILAHLTGRVIGSRDTADINFDALCKLFRKHKNLILEINGWAERLDPPAPLLQRINAEIEPPVVYSTDAHTFNDIKTNYNNCHKQALKGHVKTRQVAKALKIFRNVRKGVLK